MKNKNTCHAHITYRSNAGLISLTRHENDRIQWKTSVFLLDTRPGNSWRTKLKIYGFPSAYQWLENRQTICFRIQDGFWPRASFFLIFYFFVRLAGNNASDKRRTIIGKSFHTSDSRKTCEFTEKTSCWRFHKNDFVGFHPLRLMK